MASAVEIFAGISRVLEIGEALDAGEQHDRCSGSGNSRMRASSLSRSGRPADAGNGAKRLAGRERRDAPRRRLRGLVIGGAKGLQARLDAAAAGFDDGLERVTAEGQRAGGGERAEQAGRDLAVVFGRQRLHVEGDDALRGDAGGFDHDVRDRRWRRRAFPSRRSA